MPFGDRTGPLGLGPMTGRGSGCCAGYPVPGYKNPVQKHSFWGRGWFCRGSGRGYRHWYWATGLPGWVRAGMGYPAFGLRPAPYPYEPSPKEEMEILERQSEILKKQIEEIQTRINNLKKAQEDENK